MSSIPRDHGGGIDAAAAQYGGTRDAWVDLSTGINPVPYPLGEIPLNAWAALPDAGAMERLLTAARKFWNVPDQAEIIAAPGASAVIARMPALATAPGAYIPSPTYNEHAAAFRAHHKLGDQQDPANTTHIYVHPNNPDGHLWPTKVIGGRPLTVVDESFCDVMPSASHIARAADPGVIVLKSFGKFWGLAGLRLGFAIGRRETLFPDTSLVDMLGPWAVSGPALEIGARALEDTDWAAITRTRLQSASDRLDALMTKTGATLYGGTSLFRLYEVDDAAAWQDRLARNQIWTRTFPYSDRFLRLGLPAPEHWSRLEAAL